MTNGRWLGTGGAGYIGAHVVHALTATGREAVVVDDLSTGSASRLPTTVEVLEMTVLDTAALTDVLQRLRPTGVIHLAAKKSPTESMTGPLLYARENAGGVISLAEALRASGVTKAVFSLSCSVYGTPEEHFVDDDAPTTPESPYGDSKLYGERVLAAAAAAYGWGVVNLRYFNVVGAGGPELRDTGVCNLVPLVFSAVRTGPARTSSAPTTRLPTEPVSATTSTSRILPTPTSTRPKPWKRGHGSPRTTSAGVRAATSST